MNKKENAILIVVIFFFCLSQLYYGQNFQKSLLIDSPGNNTDIDIASSSGYLPSNTYISWINIKDSIYTVYLKKLSPVVGENIVVASDYTVKTNPQIEFSDYTKSIRIAWQSHTEKFWQINIRELSTNSFNEAIVLIDSLSNDPQISMSQSSIAWINNGKLFLKEMNPATNNPIVIDSNYCSNPDITGEILYEKNDSTGKNIYMAHQDYYPIKTWRIVKISDGGVNSNPQSGLEGGGIVYQSFINDHWKIFLTNNQGFSFKKIGSNYCNYKNPVYFNYPITTSNSIQETPFFVAFDDDSLYNDKEIMIKALYYNDSLINISTAEGDDYSPHLAYLSNNDTTFISIIWEHCSNNKIDIWMAKAIFRPIMGSVEDDKAIINLFSLSQNYPNPFNPSTVISYQLPVSGNVTLKVYDTLGREVASLVNEEKLPGNYEVKFDGSNLSIGVYFYRLQSGTFSETKKFVLMK